MINRVILFFNNDCHRVSFKRIATEGRLLRSSYAEELKNYDKDSQQMDIFSVYKSIITEAVLNPAQTDYLYFCSNTKTKKFYYSKMEKQSKVQST